MLGFTLLHENVDDALRGRVFTALYSLVRLCLLLAMAVGPFLSEGARQPVEPPVGRAAFAPFGFNIDVPGVRITLWLAGLIILLAAALSSWSLRAGERRESVIDLTDPLAELEIGGPRLMNPRGRFIVFEGGEACGKSTQARRLAERLGALFTFEPGATDLGQMMRQIVLDPDYASSRRPCRGIADRRGQGTARARHHRTRAGRGPRRRL